MPAFSIRPSRAIGLLAILTVALILVAVVLLLWQMRQRDLERARIDTASLAHMFREQTERTFETADVVLRGVQERMQTAYGSDLPLDSMSVRLLLASRVSALPQLSGVVLADVNGIVVNSSQMEVPLGYSVADTPAFKSFVTGEADGLFIGRPRRSAHGEWTLALARSFSDRRGRFRGVAIASMNIPRFDQFYAWLKLNYPRPLALYLADGTLVASVPQREDLIGRQPPELKGMALDPRDSHVRMAAYVNGDGARQVLAVAGVGRFPLLVSVASEDEPVLAGWRERSIPIALGALLVCAFIGVSGGLLAGELAREARLTRQLRDARDRYHRTIDSVMDAIIAVDEQQNIVLFNPAAQKMFGIDASDALGGPLARLIPERHREPHRHHLQAFMQSERASRGMAPNMEITGLRGDGTEFPIESTISQTWVDGKPQVTAVLRDVTARQRAEHELRDMNRQLRTLSNSLQNVREQERTRIASELHDELGQQLTGLKLELSWLAGRVKEGRNPTSDEVDSMRRQLDNAIAAVRRIATELRPRLLDDHAFDDALAWQTAEISRRSGIDIRLNLPAAPLIRDDALATALFRIVQESLTNVLRHSGATAVEILLMNEDDKLVLRVSDNGRGMARAAGDGAGIGLLSMRERATALGGRLEIHSAPDKGTSIEVTLPLDVAAQELEEAA